jgi:hypothetical protein
MSGALRRGAEYCGNPEHHRYGLYPAAEEVDVDTSNWGATRSSKTWLTRAADKDEAPAGLRGLRAGGNVKFFDRALDVTQVLGNANCKHSRAGDSLVTTPVKRNHDPILVTWCSNMP